MRKYSLKEEIAEGFKTRIIGFLLSIFGFWMFNYLSGAGFLYYHYIIFGMVCAAGILFSPLYYVFKSYDKILHFLSPFLLCFIIFFMMDKLQEAMYIKIFLTLTTAVLCITGMEVGEYIIDKALGWELQGVYVRNRSGILKLEVIQDKIDDAMQDILFGIAGCILFVLIKVLI